jgi:hypothetical protein
MNNPKRIITGLLALLLLVCLAAVAIESQAKIIRRLYDNYVLDNRDHYLPCAKWPTEVEVRTALKQHPDVARAIEAVNPGFVGMEVDTSTCPGKADLIIWYASHEDRLEIETIIAGDMFFGVPYRLQNR